MKNKPMTAEIKQQIKDFVDFVIIEQGQSRKDALWQAYLKFGYAENTIARVTAGCMHSKAGRKRINYG